MPYFSTLPETRQTQIVTSTFLGYNHNLKIGEGNNNYSSNNGLEFYDEKNLTSDFFPMFANRQKRSVAHITTNPIGIIGKAALAYIDGTEIYYGDVNITSYLTAKGAAISTDASMLPKQLVSMGAYIIIYPDKLYINTENYSDCGFIEAHFSTTNNAAITYKLCKVDGTEYDEPEISATEPTENLYNGKLWIDTLNEIHVLKQYSTITNMWTEIPTVYTKIGYSGIGTGFEKLDGVTISGISAEGSGMEKQFELLNGSKIIYEKGDDYIVVVGIIDQTYTQESGSISVSRDMPDLDYITECSNRLWGCKYGLVNGETVNEIYCCALGDFKNWNQFLGLSTDSYVASVGTDGKWTGAVTHADHPIFFKENVLHKVYVSSSGAHQIADTPCRGVQDGCSKSLVVVNETLFYKCRAGIAAYDGSLPTPVSDCFGTEKYGEAVAGAYENKYYVSLKDSNDDWHLFVFDTKKGVWHREDNTHAEGFARSGDELYYIDGDTKNIMAVNGSAGTQEMDVEWSAETGLIGYTTVEQKYVSRLNLRMMLPKGSGADMYIQYDSSDVWQHCGHMEGSGTKTFTLPIRPRRCDHFCFRIEGHGDIRIYSLSKILEVGSDE